MALNDYTTTTPYLAMAAAIAQKTVVQTKINTAVTQNSSHTTLKNAVKTELDKFVKVGGTAPLNTED